MEYRHIGEIDFKEAANRSARVYGLFLAQDVEVRAQKDGVNKYINLTMVDKDVKLNAKRFGATEQEIELMQTGKAYYAAIDVKPYTKDPSGISCVLYNFDIWESEPSSNFVSWAEGIDEAYKIINEAISYVSGTIYRNIVCNLITDNWQKFSVWPAATGHHHNILGGLMVHTAEVIRQSKVISDYWKGVYGEQFINEPLLISSALLHDLAKIYELNADQNSGIIEYSTDSALESHVTKCICMIEIEANKQNFGYNLQATPDKTQEQFNSEVEALKLLKHCVIAHHGKKEYGSPLEPSCPEAVILNKADDLSAIMFKFNKSFRTMESGTSSASWQNTSNAMITYKDTTK